MLYLMYVAYFPCVGSLFALRVVLVDGKVVGGFGAPPCDCISAMGACLAVFSNSVVELL